MRSYRAQVEASRGQDEKL